MVSTTYLAVFINVLAFLLPKFGIQVGSEELTVTLQTILTIGSGAWILYKRFQHGGINALGVRK